MVKMDCRPGDPFLNYTADSISNMLFHECASPEEVTEIDPEDIKKYFEKVIH